MDTYVRIFPFIFFGVHDVRKILVGSAAKQEDAVGVLCVWNNN